MMDETLIQNNVCEQVIENPPIVITVQDDMNKYPLDATEESIKDVILDKMVNFKILIDVMNSKLDLILERMSINGRDQLEHDKLTNGLPLRKTEDIINFEGKLNNQENYKIQLKNSLQIVGGV